MTTGAETKSLPELALPGLRPDTRLFFLASGDVRLVNGVNLPVDGGATASNGQPPEG